MLRPFRLLDDSLKLFAIGLVPGLLLAFVCLGIQVGPGMVGLRILDAILPPEPLISLEELDKPEWSEQTYARLQPNAWRDARKLIHYTLGVSTRFFFHALVALILTAWLLRKRAGFNLLSVLRRALRGACLLTGAAAVLFAAAHVLHYSFVTREYLSLDFRSLAMVGLWFGGTALLLPARLMGYEPIVASGFLRNTLTATIVLVPWFYLSEVVGAPLRHCRDCAGILDGGLIFWSVLGAYLLGLTVSSAAISAAACNPTQKQPNGGARRVDGVPRPSYS